MNNAKPKISDIGADLLIVSPLQITLALIAPFYFLAAYFVFIANGNLVLAFAMLVLLSYFSYGSVSHDLVHSAYRLPKKVNRLLLSAIELLCLRSGTAYRMAHLNHHRIFPSHKDVEGRAAAFNWYQSLVYGILFQPLVLKYAIDQGKERTALAVEISLIVTIWTISLILLPTYPQLILYCVVIHIGGWIIPFVTSYIPHRADESRELDQTRRFRGAVSSIITLEHLYHLEHHLYPAVPHQNWPQLAKRLDPYLDQQKAERILIFR